MHLTTWSNLTQQDKFFLLSTAILPIAAWYMLIARHRYANKGVKIG